MKSYSALSTLLKKSAKISTRSYTFGPKLSNPLLIPKEGSNPRTVSADEAVAGINSNTDIHLQMHASTPTELIQALVRRVDSANLKDIRFNHLILLGDIPHSNQKYKDQIRTNVFFICGGMRKHVNNGEVDYTPAFLSDIPVMFETGTVPVDYCFMTVSPPDERGFCTMGINVDVSLAAAGAAKKIIALVNPSMPTTRGFSQIHVSHFDSIVHTDREIYAAEKISQPNEVEVKIGKLIAENLVDNEATLQLGIGAIPDACLNAMGHHKNLGVHTEMFSDGVVSLMKKGVINNSKKAFMPGKAVTSFVYGTREFYDYINDNPAFYFAPANFTNHTDIVRQNSRMTSINSALEIDLSGQVVSDSIGKTLFSGFGGQTDFMTASPRAFDGLGKGIIALPSRTNKGQTKIVPYMTPGSGVVTTRAHVQYVVTEYGIAQLSGKSIRQRAYELIQIAHPDDRATLEKATFERFKLMPSK